MDSTRNPSFMRSPAPGGSDALIESFFLQFRRELTTYVTRLVVRQDIAEEIVQQAAVRWIGASAHPGDMDATRAWFFRVATHLAIDHRRRHSTWRETILLDARDRAIADEAFVAMSRVMAGSPHTKAIAREHLSVCFSCTLRNLPEAQSAALLLVEVNGFSIAEASETLELTFAQVKNAVQAARATLRDKYGSACQLIAKQGVCHQCAELSELFNGAPEDPLAGTPGDIDSRLRILREERETPLGPWHQAMMKLIDGILEG